MKLILALKKKNRVDIPLKKQTETAVVNIKLIGNSSRDQFTNHRSMNK